MAAHVAPSPSGSAGSVAAMRTSSMMSGAVSAALRRGWSASIEYSSTHSSISFCMARTQGLSEMTGTSSLTCSRRMCCRIASALAGLGCSLRPGAGFIRG